MSGYGGQPGWQDPYDRGYQQQPGYGQAPGGWQDPYSAGAPGGGYGYGYGPPGVPRARASSGSAVAALVCNIVIVLTCFGVLAIPGIVTASIAMSRTQTDPESARNLTTWSWVIFAINIVIVAAFIVIMVVAAANSPTNSTTGNP